MCTCCIWQIVQRAVKCKLTKNSNRTDGLCSAMGEFSQFCTSCRRNELKPIICQIPICQLDDISVVAYYAVVFHSIWETHPLFQFRTGRLYIPESYGRGDYIYNGQSAPLTPDRHCGASITHLEKGDPANPEFPPNSKKHNKEMIRKHWGVCSI